MTPPTDRPTASELVAAVREFLESDVVGQLDGRRRFHARVAVNVLRIVERELDHGDDLRRDVATRLADLLGTDGDAAALTTELCARLRDGRLSHDDPRVLDHLRATATAKLAIDNPRYATLPPAGATGK